MAAPSSTDVAPEPGDPDATVPASDAAPLDRIRTVAYLMDELFRIPGTSIRFGLDPILSVLPGVGSIAGTVVSLYVVVEAAVAGAPPTTLLRMLAVVAIDTVIGSVPVLGPVLDASWKANAWNVSALEDHLARSGGGGTPVQAP
jgi:hypothetical protein